jgi:hypothetical protein
MTPSARRVPMSHDPTGQPPASVNRRRCAVGAERVDGVKPTIVASNGIETAYEISAHRTVARYCSWRIWALRCSSGTRTRILD